MRERGWGLDLIHIRNIAPCAKVEQVAEGESCVLGELHFKVLFINRVIVTAAK